MQKVLYAQRSTAKGANREHVAIAFKGWAYTYRVSLNVLM